MVIVKEVICIKLIIRRNKAHKSGHYQFRGKCFRRTLVCRVQGKKRSGFPFLPNQGSNLSERTKTCLAQSAPPPPPGLRSVPGTRNELFFNCALLNLINAALTGEVYPQAVYSYVMFQLVLVRRPMLNDVGNEAVSEKCKTN